MGIKLALAYANTFIAIGYIEDNLLSQHNQLQGFIDKMNQFTPLLKSHTNLAQDIITFLDTDVHLNSIKLYVTTDIKSTNKQAHTYMPVSSIHPKWAKALP